MKDIPKPALFAIGGCVGLVVLVICALISVSVMLPSMLLGFTEGGLECYEAAYVIYEEEWNSHCEPDSPPDPEGIMDCGLDQSEADPIDQRMTERVANCFK